MKATNKTKAALLANTEEEKVYVINLELSGGKTASITVNDRTMAQQEYNRVRAASIWNGCWVTAITLNEQNS